MTGPIAKKIIDAALTEQALSYDDRIKALARAGQRLKALASDPVERLATRLVDMAGGDVRIATKDYEDVGTDMDIRAIELEVEAAVDAGLRSEVTFNIQAGRSQDLSRINRETVVAMIKDIILDIGGIQDPEKRRMAASALIESVAAAPRDSIAGSVEVLMGTANDLQKIGFAPAEICPPQIMSEMMKHLSTLHSLLG